MIGLGVGDGSAGTPTRCGTRSRRSDEAPEQTPPRGPNWKANREKRQRDLARASERHDELVKLLGGVCACCGETEPDALSIDHVDAITWERRKLRWDARVGRYWREHAEGVRLQVLCLVCNSVDGRARQLAEQNAEPAPF